MRKVALVGQLHSRRVIALGLDGGDRRIEEGGRRRKEQEEEGDLRCHFS